LTVAGVVAIAALAFAVSVLAATPKAGCWGTCGGDSGPVKGYFTVQNHKIVGGFEIELRCLGLEKIPQPVGPPLTEGNVLQVPPLPPVRTGQTGNPPPIAISDSGRFSYKGLATRRQGKRDFKIKVHMTGDFVTPTKARISLAIPYRTCGTQRVTVHFAG
jgi:hypothetical protein